MGLLTAACVALLAMLSSLRYNEDIYDFLPLDGNQQKAVTLYQDITGGKRVVAMISMRQKQKSEEGENASTPDVQSQESADLLCQAVDAFAEELRRHDGKCHIEDITTQVDFEKLSGIRDFAYHHLPQMLRDSDYVRMEHIFSNENEVEELLAHDVEMVMMPATGVFATNIANDPLGLFAPVMERMQSRQAAMPFEIDNGYIFTTGKQYAICMMTSSHGSMESAGNTLLTAYVDSVAQATMQRYKDVEIAITGSPVIAVDNARQIKADSRLAILISAVLILSLLIFAFRNGRHLLLIGITIVFGWLFAMAFIAVLRTNVSLIVLAIGSIIIGIAVNYPLHFVAHTGHNRSPREVLKDMVSPLLIGNITTVGAFAALIPLDAPALRDLGLFAAFMLIGTILFVLIFLPQMVQKKQRARGNEQEERLPFGRIASTTPRIRGIRLAIIVSLTIVLGYFSLQTTFDADMHHVNYLTPTQERLMADLRVTAGVRDTASIYLANEGANWNEALARRQQQKPLLDSLRQAGAITACTEVTAFICSEEEQAERIARWKEFWQHHAETVRRQLREHAPRHGFSEEAFSEFYDIITAEYEPEPFEAFEPLVTTLFSQSFSKEGGTSTVVDIIEARDVAQVEKILNTPFKTGTHYAFDFVGMNRAVANTLSNDFNYIGMACGAIVFLFLWISFGRLELSLLAFLPMAVGWLWILGIMRITGIQFNIVNVILATFIFGQGDDYTIFMTDGLMGEYAYRRKLLPSYRNSIIISALIMFIGMGSLIVAKHPALHSLAEVTIVGMFTVVFMAWIVPPTIFNWLTRTDNQPRRSPVTIASLVRTAYCSAVYLFEVAYGCLFGLVAHLIPYTPWRRAAKRWLHKMVCGTMRVNISHIWGVETILNNSHGEDFSKGSILICNHQSIFDPILTLALNPNITVLISEKVWKNPIVHPLFRLLGFINLNQPIETLKTSIAKAVKEGYSVVIFPEGKRNVERITRFHQGAFHIAQEIGADILPVYLHGAGHVAPKGSGLIARGRIELEVGQRIPAAELASYGDSPQRIAQQIHRQYLSHYAKMRQRIEDSHYFHHHIIDQYIYKGIAIERETRHLLRQYNDFSQWIDHPQHPEPISQSPSPRTYILHAGRGQFSLLYALVHPETEVHSYADDPDDMALAAACSQLPQNLHIHLKGQETNVKNQEDALTIDFNQILKDSLSHKIL